MLIYRPHRGSLAEAMVEAKTFSSFDEIKEYVANKWNSVWGDRKSTRLNSSLNRESRMPSSA